MVRILTVIFVLALATLACSLGGSEEPTAVPPRQINTGFTTPTSAFVVVTSTPTTTPAATSTPFNNTGSNSGSSSGSGNVSTCTKRTDWYVYTVKSGDTLSAVARSVQSDAVTLQNANCLANPNSLSVGQVLYVPRQPIPPTITPIPATATATSVNVTYLGKVTFSEGTMLDNDNIQLSAGHTINLAYPASSASAHHVDFLLATADGKVSGIIGSDNNLGDGATVTWTVPTGLNGNLVYANLFQTASTLTQTSLRIKVHTNSVATEGSINLSHIVLDNQEGAFTLQPGATITVTYVGARTDLGRAEFALYNPNTDGWTPLGVGVDTNLSDGASLAWTVPYGLSGQHIFASTYDSGGTQAQMIMTNYVVDSINSPADNGTPNFFPMLGSGNPDAVFLIGNEEVTVLWYEMPLQTAQIEFYFQPDDVGGIAEAPTLIGTDTEWRDGATVSWLVPDEIVGSIYAIATFDDDSTIMSNSVNVFSH